MRTTARVVLALALVGAAGQAPVLAEDGVKALPTLLIKGEVVSVDVSDPSGTLLKVKDRYGFETPIFLTTDTKISQGEAAQQASALAAGTPVEVEYNFDINTAKRHAVSVKVASPAAAAPAETPAAPAPDAEPAPAEVPAAPDAMAPEATPAPEEAPADPAAEAPAQP
jgi:hypothetical protein